MVSQPESEREDGSTASSSQQPGSQSAPDPHPGGDLRQSIEELVDYALYYLSAHVDSVKFKIRRRILVASMIAVAVLAGAGAVVTGVVIFCDGICDGLSRLLGWRWAGELLTGFLLLAVVALGAYLFLHWMIRQSYNRMVAKYQAMRQRHRERFGRDVP
jgi:hypothetical protein